MTNQITDISQRKAAIVAGFAFLIMAIAAFFANFFVFSSLIVPGDAATTANNILASEGLFRSGIAGWLVLLITDVLVAWALYVFLKTVNKSLSLLTAWFRLVYTAIFGIAVLNFLIVLLLLGGAEYLTVFKTDQSHALVLLFINAFSIEWDFAAAFFGIHLALLGYLVYKSGYMPRIMGVLLIIAGIAYLIQSFGSFLLPDYENYEAISNMVVGMTNTIGELWLAFWLLLKGGKIPSVEHNNNT